MSANTYHSEPVTSPAAPTSCPMHKTWSPLDDDYVTDPYPIASALRSAHPVFYAPTVGCVVVTDMADVEAAFSDHETFASTNVQDPVFPLSPEARKILSAEDFDPVAVMSNRPEPDHGRIRRYTRQGFSNRRINTLDPYVRRRAHELIDAMITMGPPAEFVASFAFPLPGETIFRFIGFPESDDETLKAWCGDRKAFSWGRPTPAQQVEIAENMLAYWRYCRDFTAHKRRHRGDDFASELIGAHEADPDDLSYREVESIIYGLSFAGHEAVTALICNTLMCLLPRRDTWTAIRENPTLIPNAIEEVLRYAPPVVNFRRTVTEKVELHGTTLDVGDKIYLSYPAANRDPEMFPDPDRFDVTRENAARHLAFGIGPHSCIGARLARMQLFTHLREMIARMPDIRHGEIERMRSIWFDSVIRMPVTFTPEK